MDQTSDSEEPEVVGGKSEEHVAEELSGHQSDATPDKDKEMKETSEPTKSAEVKSEQEEPDPGKEMKEKVEPTEPVEDPSQYVDAQEEAIPASVDQEGENASQDSKLNEPAAQEEKNETAAEPVRKATKRRESIQKIATNLKDKRASITSNIKSKRVSITNRVVESKVYQDYKVEERRVEARKVFHKKGNSLTEWLFQDPAAPKKELTKEELQIVYKTAPLGDIWQKLDALEA